MHKLALALALLAACGTSSSSETPDAAAPSGTDDARPPGTPDSAPDPAEPDAAPTAESPVPAEATALFAYLQSRTYQELAAESGVHASAGPHGGGVRTFINATLADSLAAGNDRHPVGAAAVKELHGSGGLSGWAVSVKIEADSDDGDGWYWYEVFSTTNGSNPIEGAGHPTCKGCHSGGDDFVLIPFPLQ